MLILSAGGACPVAGTRPRELEAAGRSADTRRSILLPSPRRPWAQTREGPAHPRTPLATERELATFLAEAERRAFKQAVFAVRNDQVALDLVQDAMLRLVEKYAGKPAAELPLLFQRILQNAIRDHYRRSRVRTLWTTLLSSLQGKDGDEERDPLDTLRTDAGVNRLGGPAEQAERGEVLRLIEQGLEALPARQREAFLLRYWEQLDVAETAQAMGCSEGSVKTHCSRATHSLAIFLKSRGVEL
jgi:RNA polymerase sigma-70 factor (ECF subfamily)